MKKSYFLMAAAAALFAACSETDFVNEATVQDAPKAIGFETFAYKSTRAENSTAENSTADYVGSLSSHHTTFTVWGHKLVGTTATTVFDEKSVTNTSADVWSYGTPLVYWDKAADNYEFYAAAPTKADFWTLEDNATSNVISDDYITTDEFAVQAHNAVTGAYATAAVSSFQGVANAEDLMIAAPKSVADYSQAVQLQFIHILSRLNVAVKTSLDNVIVKHIVVGNMASTGTFDESDATITTASSTLRWTKTAGTVDYVNETDEALTKDAAAKIAIDALVMPQVAVREVLDLSATTFTDKKPYLFVEYTVNGETNTRAYNLADVFNGDTDTDINFNEGYQNTLNITIGANAIEFSTQVAEWAATTPATPTVQ